jgi:hypothetical protein
MSPCPLAAWIAGLLCAAVIFFGLAAPARAAAPMCDDRAASAIAPPPIDPLPDLRWEPGMPRPCVPAFMPLGFALLQPGDASATARPSTVQDALVTVRPAALAKRGSAHSTAAPESVLLSNGFPRSVFRPPRAPVP